MHSSDHDIEDWIKELINTSNSNVDKQDSHRDIVQQPRENEYLAHAIKHWAKQQKNLADIQIQLEQEEAWQKLRFRLLSEGLIDTQANAQKPDSAKVAAQNANLTKAKSGITDSTTHRRQNRRWRTWIPSAAAAAMLVALVAPLLWQQEQIDLIILHEAPPEMRGIGAMMATTTIMDNQPEHAARRIAALVGDQVEVIVYIHAGVATLDIFADASNYQKLQELLRTDIPGITLYPRHNRIIVQN